MGGGANYLSGSRLDLYIHSHKVSNISKFLGKQGHTEHEL